MLTPQILETADPALLANFDDIIDVRSPGEFAQDHVPGAINLPVLDDAERALVGTIYVQDSAFRARRIGAAIVARNVAHHLETALIDRPPGYKPVVYCWRGGQRSNAMATILSQIGWRTAILEGGYRTYRRRVQRRLYDEFLAIKLVLLDGGTGAGKTEMLQALAASGVQILDLEALAEHRGSLFGARAGETQPRQKMFESRLLAALDALDLKLPVVAEAESNRIGDLSLPPAVWSAMARAQRVLIEAPLGERARYLASRYQDIAADHAALRATISRLPVHIGRKQLDELKELVETAKPVALAEALMRVHYDPAYARSARKAERANLAVFHLERLDSASIQEAAHTLAVQLRGSEDQGDPA